MMNMFWSADQRWFFGFSWRLVILGAEQIKRIPASGNEIEKVWNYYMHNERVELYEGLNGVNR